MTNLVVIDRIRKLRDLRTQPAVPILKLTAFYPVRIPIAIPGSAFHKTHGGVSQSRGVGHCSVPE